MENTTNGVDLPSRFLTDTINPWFIGADPEFAVLTPPDVVVPNQGPHAVNTTKPAGAIGSDHGGRVWELRPAPSRSAYVVATNLWKLLRQAEMDKLERFKWKSGALGGKRSTAANQPYNLQARINQYIAYGYGIPAATTLAQQDEMAHNLHQGALQASAEAAQTEDTLGGHVHFDIAGFNSAQRAALNAVTTGLLNLDILPQKENSRRLTISAYGKFTHDAVRDCNGHVEYRCAPSWLDRPGQAFAALTTYKLAGARPSSVKWPTEFELKAGFENWLDTLSRVDVDAWVLLKFIEEQGFEKIQADPSSDFKPRWRRENPWDR